MPLHFKCNPLTTPALTQHLELIIQVLQSFLLIQEQTVAVAGGTVTAYFARTVASKMGKGITVPSMGIEPTTLGLLDPRSNQLSYDGDCTT